MIIIKIINNDKKEQKRATVSAADTIDARVCDLGIR